MLESKSSALDKDFVGNRFIGEYEDDFYHKDSDKDEGDRGGTRET